MMIVWILCFAAFTLTTTRCEPPVNSYLPPNSGFGAGTRPSSQYGPPGRNQGGATRENGPLSGFGSQQRDGQSSPSSEYGVPGQGASGFSRGGSRSGSPDYQGSNGNFGGRSPSQRPDTSYGVPSNEIQSSNAGFNGINAGQGSRQRLGGSPSSSYGAPDFGNNINSRNENYRESGVNESNEPAKYEFSYEVDDPETGTKFGHSEQRDGDVTTGEYNVVLPDGRKQVVEYEADQEGYKPQIRYEGAAGNFGSGFGPGGQNRRLGNQNAGANANANANAGSEEGYPLSGNRQQIGRYQEPGTGFGQGSGTAGYPSGRPDEQGFGNQGPDDFSGGRRGDGFSSSSPGGYPGSSQASRGGSREGGRGSNGLGEGGRGSNGLGGDDGYPSGGPNGQRGSGY